MITEEQSTTELPSPNGFAIELSDRMGQLRAALGRMLAELGSPKSASDLHKLSGAGQTICWQVFRIVNANELANEARKAPTPSSLKRLLAAAASSGVSEKTIQAVQASAEAFQAFSKRVADDRAAFDSMLGGIGSEKESGKILLPQRRAAYRAISHISGVQTDLLYSAAMVRLSASGEAADGVSLIMHRGIRRLRPDANVTVFGYHRNPSDTPGAKQPEDAVDREAAERYDMPVLPQFCSNPVPRVKKVALPGGWVLYNTVDHEIGHNGNLDCTFGRLNRGMPFMTDIDGRHLFHQTFAHIRKPVAMTVQELLVHRASFPNARPEVMIYQHAEGEQSQESARQAQQYPVEERLIKVGRADSVELADVPRYSELLRVGADASGWELSEFDIYRLRMPYPIMYSEIRIFFYVD